MPMVHRFHVTDTQGLFWTGSDFTRDDDIALEYRDIEEAETDALECGGEVSPYQRFSKHPDYHPTLISA